MVTPEVQPFHLIAFPARASHTSFLTNNVVVTPLYLSSGWTHSLMGVCSCEGGDRGRQIPLQLRLKMIVSSSAWNQIPVLC